MGTNTTKPYKIQGANGVGRVGITAADLEGLKREAVERLNISPDFQAYLDDWTEVSTEKYFKSLPPQTCFTFCAPREDTLDMDLIQLQILTLRISNKFAELPNKALEEVAKFLSGDNAEVINRALRDYLTSLQSNIDVESREEDEAWFHGLPKRYQTKEAVMKDGAKTRIRNYYQKTREYVIEQNSGPALHSLLDVLRKELLLNDYNGQYFVRSADNCLRICDEDGWFKCEGKFNENYCLQSHSINPYGSREARIVFSTWNLDHVIEKSREVLPRFVEASNKCPKDRELNWQYFYDLLFTKKNLKLVHIACHIKEAHASKKCDKKQFYKAKKRPPGSSKVQRPRSKRTRK